ncbi:hypothetical protein [Bacillus tuaregi]|uniref:hypothetical protein n=1 Tax=Bacillus tuaregi TaxID=1816695 RepID=UPI0008F9567D|nr:hypothetical protein [Bacillus tuaregi]
MMTVFFTLSILFFSASLHFFISIKKPGVYPPKFVLKRRSAAMAVGGVFFLIIGFVMSLTT